MLKRLIDNGKRISVGANELLKTYDNPGEIIDELLKMNAVFITEEDVKKAVNIINKIKEEKKKKEEEVKKLKKEEDWKNRTLEKEGEEEKTGIKEAKNELNANKNINVNRGKQKKPMASEYEGDIRLISKYEKSTSKGEISDFIEHFRYRFAKMSKLFSHIVMQKIPQINISDVKKNIGQRVRIIVMVYSKNISKKGNIVLHVEDLTGQFLAVVGQYNEKTYKMAKTVVEDDTIMLVGKVLDAFLIVDEIHFPDVPITKERKLIEKDLATVYISDIHFGSRYFLDKVFDRFTKWLKGDIEGGSELSQKVKYLLIAGDVVDGIGIYPNQEKELSILDIEKQYNMFNQFLDELPDYIEVVVIPGNHDAVRRAEPMPAIPSDFINRDVINVQNPSWVKIEGITHLIYHGTSFDSVIARVPKMSYSHPEEVMRELLKRRHMSPFYGGNLIVPEHIDHMIINDPPDVFHAGHVHKNGYMMYRNSLIINSGTFQDRTSFQIRQGHIPTPGMVPVYEMKYGKLKTIDFIN